MELQEVKKICEALLFTSNKPIRLEDFRDVLDLKDSKLIKEAIAQLECEYKTQERAFEVSEIAGGYIITTFPEYGKWLKKLFKDKYSWRLSGPALETLAIIAYRQPVTKSEVESVRGVNVDGVISSLLDRDLIKIGGRKEVLGRPLLYATTKEFLYYFGLNSINELPPLDEIIVSNDNEVEQDDNGNDSGQEVSIINSVSGDREENHEEIVDPTTTN